LAPISPFLFFFLISAIFAFLLSVQPDRQSRTFPLPAGRTLTLEITIGDVRIEGSSGTDAVIDITRQAPNAESLARIPIQIEEEASEVRIRLVQTENGTDPAFRSNITMRVPHDAALRAVRIVEGRLTLVGLRGAITADVRRGPIEASNLEGVVRLETGIGDVVANRARLSPNGLLRLRAFNGDVRLTLAEKPVNARILALALNGTITSDIPLRMKDTWGPRWGEATLGSGEPVISIDVITGEIQIKTSD
jgi:DUF4097 and DUF4098 domain-containing protein YvlB